MKLETLVDMFHVRQSTYCFVSLAAHPLSLYWLMVPPPTFLKSQPNGEFLQVCRDPLGVN